MNARNWWKISALIMAPLLGIAIARELPAGAEQVPTHTVRALKAHFPDCEITKVDSKEEYGEHLLLLRLEDAAHTQNILAKASLAGDLLDLDQDIDRDDLPRHIEGAFVKALPNAEVTHVEKGTRLEISYRLDIVQNGRKHEVKITRKGRIFEVVSRD